MAIHFRRRRAARRDIDASTDIGLNGHWPRPSLETTVGSRARRWVAAVQQKLVDYIIFLVSFRDILSVSWTTILVAVHLDSARFGAISGPRRILHPYACAGCRTKVSYVVAYKVSGVIEASYFCALVSDIAPL